MAKGLKKGERLSSLTWGQARVRGFTKKQHTRAVNIKLGIAKAKKRIKELFTPPRERQQVTFNSDYSISLRAIAINADLTEKELENALDNFLKGEEQLQRIPFSTKGIETEELSDDEDAGLEEGIIHIELNIGGSVTLISL